MKLHKAFAILKIEDNLKDKTHLIPQNFPAFESYKLAEEYLLSLDIEQMYNEEYYIILPIYSNHPISGKDYFPGKSKYINYVSY